MAQKGNDTNCYIGVLSLSQQDSGFLPRREVDLYFNHLQAGLSRKKTLSQRRGPCIEYVTQADSKISNGKATLHSQAVD